MDKKLLLISLRDPFLDSDRVMPPVGVMSLQSYMTSLGIDSMLENNFDLDNTDKYDEYTHFGISCMTPQKVQAYEILHTVKNKLNNKIVILGGPHAKYYLQDCIKEPFDFIVIGDGEFALRDIMFGLAKDRVLDIPVSQDEMNKMPPPYRDPSFLTQYNFSIQGINSSTILTAKGCPMKCTFCEDAGTKVKLYTPDNISKHIEDVKKAGFEGVMFFDDIFAISKKRVRDLSEVIAPSNLIYRCFGHAKSMDDEMARMLSDSGCIETGFGAESGSQVILNVVGKGTTVEQNMRYVETCNKFGIKVKAFVIVGLPGETLDTVNETKKFIEFLLSNKFTNRFGHQVTNDFDTTIYFPYKGTKIRDSIDAGFNEFDLHFTTNPDDMSGFYKGKGGSAEAAVRTSGLDGEDIVKIQHDILKKVVY
jgi:anaerobic magnesium-protoporphyrin IX monomethyl ester cyclase